MHVYWSPILIHHQNPLSCALLICTSFPTRRRYLKRSRPSPSISSATQQGRRSKLEFLLFFGSGKVANGLEFGCILSDIDVGYLFCSVNSFNGINLVSSKLISGLVKSRCREERLSAIKDSSLEVRYVSR